MYKKFRWDFVSKAAAFSVNARFWIDVLYTDFKRFVWMFRILHVLAANFSYFILNLTMWFTISILICVNDIIISSQNSQHYGGIDFYGIVACFVLFALKFCSSAHSTSRLCACLLSCAALVLDRTLECFVPTADPINVTIMAAWPGYAGKAKSIVFSCTLTL